MKAKKGPVWYTLEGFPPLEKPGTKHTVSINRHDTEVRYTRWFPLKSRGGWGKRTNCYCPTPSSYARLNLAVANTLLAERRLLENPHAALEAAAPVRKFAGFKVCPECKRSRPKEAGVVGLKAIWYCSPKCARHGNRLHRGHDD